MIAAGTAMGMLVPPAIFMIVIAQVTNTSAVTLFLGGFFPAFVIMICLMALVYLRARKYDWPVDARPSIRRIGRAGSQAAVPLVVPIVILGDSSSGSSPQRRQARWLLPTPSLPPSSTIATCHGLRWRGSPTPSAILTAAVIVLLAVASIFQYLMGMQGVPKLLGEVLEPLKEHHWLFLFGTAFITMMFGMVLEGLPAAVVLIPVVLPIAERMGINPIHFNIVQTAAGTIGLFLPPMGVGLLMALKFANLSVGEHFRTYVPYIVALLMRPLAHHLPDSRDQPDAAAAGGPHR